MDVHIPKKVLRYETFINDVLKEQLKQILINLDRINTEIAEYVQLKNVIQTIQDVGVTEDILKTQVDIGCNFYMQAKITDPTKIYMNVGLGHFVEFTLDEVVKVIELRTNLLNRQICILREQSANTKAHIKLVLHGLQELQNIK